MRALAALLLLAASACSASSLDCGARSCPQGGARSHALDEPAVVWQGESARLTRRGPAELPRARLVVDGVDAAGATTEFIVDTGSAFTLLSATAPASRAADVDPRSVRLPANQGTRTFVGSDAKVRSLDIGGLSARGLPVFLSDRPHDLRAPGNVAGMTWMGALALRHDATADAWTLERAGTPFVGSPGAYVALEAPAFPVVTVLDDQGARHYALIDTGTPKSLVSTRALAGHYRVVSADGTTLLDVHATELAPWSGLAPRGRTLTLFLGLDDLSRASFELNFPEARWTFRNATPTASAPTPARR